MSADLVYTGKGAVISAGLEVRHVAEYAEPFWRPANVTAAAWRGQLPNSFALVARRMDPSSANGKR